MDIVASEQACSSCSQSQYQRCRYVWLMIALISAFVTPSIVLITSHPKVRAFLARFSSDEEGVYMHSPYIPFICYSNRWLCRDAEACSSCTERSGCCFKLGADGVCIWSFGSTAHDDCPTKCVAATLRIGVFGENKI